MRLSSSSSSFSILLLFLLTSLSHAEDAYKYFTWTVTYGSISPLGSPQQFTFQHPVLETVTNDNIVINVINKIDEPFLITWNGIKQRKNSWQDGVLGTNCPIPSGSNFTYKFQTKDQIGTFTYFASTGMHRAAGGFGALIVRKRAPIPIPYSPPDGDFSLLVGDWFKAGHKALRQSLDAGKGLGFPDGLLINGVTQSASFTGDQGKTYMFRVSNIGLSVSVNFKIQNHKLKLVEVEGSHTIQNLYSSLDLHVGQSMSVLVTLDQPSKDYYIVASSQFTEKSLVATGVLHYSNSNIRVSGQVPVGPASTIEGSMSQATTIRWNLTANAARPNPQGSYHYGTVPITRKLFFANSAPMINGKQRYAVNGVSFVVPDTPLKLADNFNIGGVFSYDTIPVDSSSAVNVLRTTAIRLNHHDFVEIVFQNTENSMQSWHLDGYDFWVVGYGGGRWSGSMRQMYNLVDAVTRHTVQVYPNGWSAILVSLENQGMWNVRSANWARQYLGQQFYFRVWNAQQNLANEYAIPPNVLLCGKAIGFHP